MTQNSTTLTLTYQHHLPLHLCWLVLGLFGTTSNSLIMLTIGKTKNLRNKSQFVIFSHSFSELCFASTTFVIGFRGCVLYFGDFSPSTIQSTCTFWLLPQYVCATATMTATLQLGVDRLLASKFAVFYKNVSTYKYVSVFNSALWTFAGLHLIDVFALTLPYANGTVVPMCTFVYSFSAFNQSIAAGEGGVLVFCTLAVYIAALVTVGYRYWGTKWLNEAQRATWARKVQLEAFKTIMIMGAMYFLFWAVVVVVQTISNCCLRSELGDILFLYVGLLLNVNGVSHLLIYLILNRKFRFAFSNLVFRKDVTLETPVMTIKVVRQATSGE